MLGYLLPFNVKKAIKQASEIKCFQQLELQMNGWNIIVFVYGDDSARCGYKMCVRVCVQDTCTKSFKSSRFIFIVAAFPE